MSVRKKADPAVSPLATVVIPCHNHARFLGNAIASVQRQSYAPVEVIVVDDGSTDGSAEVARAAGAVVVTTAKSGLSAARNTGLAAARGTFIVFLDADDELLSDAVGSGVRLLQRNASLACVVRRSQVMDAEGRALSATYTPVDDTDLYRQWLRENFVWTPGAVVFRRAGIAEIGGFPLDLSPASDYAVYLALARAGAVAFDDREAVRYRQHDDNMSNDPVLMLNATLEVLRRERSALPARCLADYRAAVNHWRSFYGERIIDRLRRERRAGVSGRWQATALWTLVAKCPRVLATHACRKFSRAARGLPRSPLEPRHLH